VSSQNTPQQFTEIKIRMCKSDKRNFKKSCTYSGKILRILSWNNANTSNFRTSVFEKTDVVLTVTLGKGI